MSHIERGHSSPEKKSREPKKISEEVFSEQRLGDHLAAYGNHEGKAGLLAAMKPDTPYTTGRLDSLANPDKKVWGERVAFDWCRDSLAPLGLVTNERVDKKKRPIAYEKTKEGEELGEAFGGHLLELSENLPVSLYQLSGSTQSPSKTKNHKTETGTEEETKNRAPLTRFHIAKELVNGKLPIRETDLVASLKTDYPDLYDYASVGRTIERQAQKLAEAGIITFEGISVDADYSFYSPVATRPNRIPKAFSTQHSLTYRVDRLLSETEKPHSAKDVYAALIQQYPDYRNHKEDTLTNKISSILAHLTREGYAKNEGFNKELQSAITLTQSQKETLGKFVDLGEKFQSLDPDFLTEGREKARVIVTDKERFTALMEKAHKASAYTQMTDPAETSKKILTYVKNNPGVTNDDIRIYLQEGGQNIGTTRIGQITGSLRSTGKLIGEKEKHSMHYFLPKKP